MATTFDPSIHVFLPHFSPRWGEIKSLLSQPSPTTLPDFCELLKKLNPETPTDFFDRYLSGQTQPPADQSLSSPHFLLKLLPFLLELALQVEKLFPSPIEKLRSLSNSTTTPTPTPSPASPTSSSTIGLTRQQVACLLAHGLFCTYPTNYTSGGHQLQNPQHLNFTTLLSFAMGPGLRSVKTILNYFVRIQNRWGGGGEGGKGDWSQEKILIHRRRIQAVHVEGWKSSAAPLAEIKLFQDGAMEEDLSAQFQADFANKTIGEGVLQGLSTQEELLFISRPECLVSFLFCDAMADNEAIIISGAEQFTLVPRGGGFKYGGDAHDKTPLHKGIGCLRRHIVAIDAVEANGSNQYQTHNVLRDVNKIYAALHNASEIDPPSQEGEIKTFATGHWGCTYHAGNKELKFIEQWMGASQAGIQQIHYYSFGEKEFNEKFYKVYPALKKLNVGQLFELLEVASDDCTQSIFDFIQERERKREEEALSGSHQK